MDTRIKQEIHESEVNETKLDRVKKNKSDQVKNFSLYKDRKQTLSSVKENLKKRRAENKLKLQTDISNQLDERQSLENIGSKNRSKVHDYVYNSNTMGR